MSMLPVAGCDPHLDTITVAVIDPGTGAELVTRTVPNSQSGWEMTVALCQQVGITRAGIEGASGLGRRLAQTLSGAGVEVLEVPTRLTAATRRIDGAGKTDPGDARTVARAVARGEGNRWSDTPVFETLRIFTSRRDHLVSDQTRDINELRALLIHIDPQLSASMNRIRSRRQLQSLTQLDITPADPHQTAIIQLVTEIAATCLRRLNDIEQLTARITEAMPPVGQALIEAFVGCGVIVAAQILSQLAGTDGFHSDAKMAAWAGTAPLDATSGRQQRHRLNRGGNRQANRAIHTIITTQLRFSGQAHTYIQRRTAEGKTTREATRAAKRHLTRRIWKILRDHGLTPTPQLT